jgi:hypothetical protein
LVFVDYRKNGCLLFSLADNWDLDEFFERFICGRWYIHLEQTIYHLFRSIIIPSGWLRSPMVEYHLQWLIVISRIKNRFIDDIHSNFFFGRNLFEIGESAQLRFALKNFGRISPNVGEFRPLLSRRFCWIREISPKSKEIRPKFLGRNLTARVHPFRARKTFTVFVSLEWISFPSDEYHLL